MPRVGKVGIGVIESIIKANESCLLYQVLMSKSKQPTLMVNAAQATSLHDLVLFLLRQFIGFHVTIITNQFIAIRPRESL